MVSIVGDVWQQDMTRNRGAREISNHIGYPDLRKLLEAYETRNGRCSSFTIEVVK